MRNMRNQPSPKTGKTDIIDRHTKGRCIIIESSLLYTVATQDYAMLLIDINELSDYYDTIVTCKEKDYDYTKNFVEHWGLKAKVKVEFTDYEELLQEYRILLCLTTRTSKEKYKQYYRTEVLGRC